MMRRAFSCALLPLLLAVAARGQVWPTGTVTRTFSGPVEATVAGIPQSGTVTVEITAKPEAFAQPSGGVFTVRGKFDQPPLLALGLTNWSHLIRASVSGEPVRADVQWVDGSGRIGVDRAADWSRVTAQAQGRIIGLEATIPPTTLGLVATVTNEAAAVSNAPPAEVVDPTRIAIIGKHKFDVARVPVTRRLMSARIEGSNVRLAFEPLGWPSNHDPRKPTDGRVCICWQQGDGFTGGHFDWHGIGQQVKTLGNVFAGYLDGQQPPRGARVWFWLQTEANDQRTNLIESENTW